MVFTWGVHRFPMGFVRGFHWSLTRFIYSVSRELPKGSTWVNLWLS